MLNNLNQKYLRFTPILLFLLLAEILSYACHFYPEMNTIIFFIVCFFTLILSLTKLEYGLYILLAELFVGSKGYIFSLETGGVSFSIRIAIFLIVIGVWLLKFFELWLKQYKQTKKIWVWPTGFLNLRKSNLAKWYVILFIFIAWGLIEGIIKGNGFANVFFDFNAWLYFALVFVFFDVIINKKQIKNILIVLYAGLTLLAIRTLVVLYIFSHQFQSLMPSIYRWMTDFKLGEIAPIKFGFYRVFIQSQIYCLIGFFIILTFILFRFLQPKVQNQKPKTYTHNILYSNIDKQDHRQKSLYILFIIAGLPLLISFSRSYWVGILDGLIALLVFLKFTFKIQWGKIFKTFGFLIFIGIIEIGIVYTVINLPPKSGSMINFKSLMEERISKQEAASQSRINQILPLLKSISRHPIIGSGFGTTVTYKSLDPRQITESNPEGWYTTYAFEWNYLDIILKIGLAGLIVYLILIWKIFKKGFKIIYQNPLVLGLLLGIIAVAVTNIFSPYLNHPLGIGYLLLSGAIFTVFKKD